MSFFDECFTELLGVEGHYSNDPSDSGGETCWGITEAVARAYGYAGHMREMPVEVAKAIYRERYWDYSRLDEVAELSPAVAREIFDTSVNLGQARAVGYLQRALNAFNQNGTLYPDLTVDGGLGKLTIQALRKYFSSRGQDAEAVLLRALNALQGAFYIDLAESRPKDEKYAFGWFRARIQ